MIDPSEDSLVKIDALISGIRMINLHVFNYFSEYLNPRIKGTKDQTREKQTQQVKKLNAAHFQENMKFINEYLRKSIKDMAKIRIYLTPIVYRPMRIRAIKDQNFLRFENTNYGVKFLFTQLVKECLLNIEIYRKVGGRKISGQAIRKLELTFTHDIYIRYPESQFTSDILQFQGKNILEQITTIFSGQKCPVCQKHLILNNELMIFLPPTIREIQQMRDQRQTYRIKRYYHQSCL